MDAAHYLLVLVAAFALSLGATHAAWSQGRAQLPAPAPVEVPTQLRELPPAAPPAAPYTLRTAVGEALARNPAISAAGADRASAGYLRESAEWGRFPTLSAEFTPGISTGSSTGSSRLVRLDQPLWSAGRIDGQIDLAKAQERSAQLGESESKRSIAEQTAVVYLGWAGAQERLRVAVDGGAIFERLLAYVDRRQQAGAATLSDVTVARARLSAAAAQREQLQGELDRVRAELQALVAGGVGSPVAVEVPAYYAASDADSVERSYLEQSNVAAQRAADVEAARAAMAVQRGRAWPTLSLRVEHQQTSGGGGASTPSATRALLALQFNAEPGLAAFSSIRASESRVAAAEEQVRVAALEIRLRARTQLAEQQSASRQLADLQPQINDLQATADSYLRQFEAGRKSWIEVLNIYRETLDARINLSRTQTLRDQSALRLMGNTGVLISWIDNPRR